MKEKIKQERYAQAKFIEDRLNLVNSQIQNLNEQIIGLKNVTDSLSELKKVKKDSDSLISLASGLLVKAEIKETKKVFMNVGADVIVKKDSDEAKKTIEKKIDDLTKVKSNLEIELNDLTEKLREISTELFTNV